MNLKKYYFLLLFLFIALSLQAQKSKHTLFFYPLAANAKFVKEDLRFPDTLKLVFFENKFINPVLGLGYNYQFNKNWAFDTKFFANQETGRTEEFEIPFSASDKSMKVGFQYFFINKKFLLNLGLYASFRNKAYYFFSRVNNVYRYGRVEREFGAELGIGLGYRISKRTRLSLGAAFRYSEIEKVFADHSTSWKEKAFLPFESLGFAYSF